MMSNRRYFSIVIIFITILVLFQGLLLSRILAGNVHINTHTWQDALTASQSRQASGLVRFDDMLSSSSTVENMSYILFIGASDSPYAGTIEEWAAYNGKTVFRRSSLPEPGDYPLPDVILMSPEKLQGNETILEWFLNRGTDMLCLALPDADVIGESSSLMKLLGISEIRQKNIHLAGIHLYSGFFLGGERIYKEEEVNSEGEEDHSLDLDVPWYVTRVKTKTFLRGILSDSDQAAADEAKLKNEDMPSLIWSSHSRNGTVFAVCGDYFSSRKLGFGILSAVDYERTAYSLYSVVNAQVFSLVDFPIMADENDEGMHKVYGRGMDRFEEDIIVPQLQALEARYGYRASCFMAPKYDYNDAAEADVDTADHFIGLINSIEGEMGLSMRYAGDITFQEKLAYDENYYASKKDSLPIGSAYADEDRLPEVIEQIEKHGAWDSIRTISLSSSDSLPVLGYVTENITVQQVTSDSLSHTYFEDLELIGLETALAYDNTSLIISDTLWPDGEEAEWQNVSRRFTANMYSYYVPFSAFEKVLASESNSRVRGYLNRSYTVDREGSVITLSMSEYDDTASFILRTHDEKVVSVEGAACREIENNAYLVTPEGNEVRITVRSSHEAILFPEVAY